MTDRSVVHAAFADIDQADGRRQGTSDLLDAMGASLSTQSVDA